MPLIQQARLYRSVQYIPKAKEKMQRIYAVIFMEWQFIVLVLQEAITTQYDHVYV